MKKFYLPFYLPFRPHPLPLPPAYPQTLLICSCSAPNPPPWSLRRARERERKEEWEWIFFIENLPFRPYPNPLLRWAAYLLVSNAAVYAAVKRRRESTAMPAAVACRASTQRRIIVDDGECGCHFFVVWRLVVWCVVVRKPKTTQNLSVLKFFLQRLTKPQVLTKYSRCVLMMSIYCTWLEVSILPVEREKTPRHQILTFILLRTVGILVQPL